ncbi:MAG: response regulator [Bdellovibrionota bacterium]
MKFDMNTGATLRCIVVEDSAFMREIYYYSLRDRPNIEIIAEAADGEEALRLISEIKPDILILDLILPLKNGFEVLSEMSAISPQTKTIVISSLEDETMVLKAKALGAIEFLKKPFTKIQLMSVLDEVSSNYAEVNNG